MMTVRLAHPSSHRYSVFILWGVSGLLSSDECHGEHGRDGYPEGSQRPQALTGQKALRTPDQIWYFSFEKILYSLIFSIGIKFVSAEFFVRQGLMNRRE